MYVGGAVGTLRLMAARAAAKRASTRTDHVVPHDDVPSSTGGDAEREHAGECTTSV